MAKKKRKPRQTAIGAALISEDAWETILERRKHNEDIECTLYKKLGDDGITPIGVMLNITEKIEDINNDVGETITDIDKEAERVLGTVPLSKKVEKKLLKHLTKGKSVFTTFFERKDGDMMLVLSDSKELRPYPCSECTILPNN